MVGTFRSVSTTHSQLSGNIPETFRSQPTSKMHASYSPSSSEPRSLNISPQQQHTGARSPHGTEAEMRHSHAVSLADLRNVAADIKNTLMAAITDMRSDIQAMTMRVEEVEITQAHHETSLCQVQQLTESHAFHLREINRHMEDLDNRGRRRNLRVRGIPESIDPTQLSLTVTNILNDLLERPLDTPIAFEQIHRALCPRGRETDLPRVCCLMDFPLKEEILRKARSCNQLSFQGATIKFYQDLFNITLQRRRELRPLLEVLRARSIIYRWKFPFCLSVTHQGRSANLKVPEVL